MSALLILSNQLLVFGLVLHIGSSVPYWLMVDCFLLVAATAPPASGEPMKPKDPRDLEDLLDFIEGNPSLKCKDEKKAAKKARQKQKKVRFI